jgi:hypothetical protein
MSRRPDIDVMNIDIFLRGTHSKRNKVFLLMDFAYSASRNTFIHVYSRPCPFRGLFDEIKGAISRIIAFLIKGVPPGFLDR